MLVVMVVVAMMSVGVAASGTLTATFRLLAINNNVYYVLLSSSYRRIERLNKW